MNGNSTPARASRRSEPSADGQLATECRTAQGSLELGSHGDSQASLRSRRVAEKLGFREEGLYVRYLDIDGGWRDHVSYALTVEDVPNGLLQRLRERSA